jgi:hypothetical protein
MEYGAGSDFAAVPDTTAPILFVRSCGFLSQAEFVGDMLFSQMMQVALRSDS